MPPRTTGVQGSERISASGRSLDRDRDRGELRRIVAALVGTDRMSALADGDSLLGAGVIDSLVMIELLAKLETTHGIVVADDEMTPENFDSIDAIDSFLSRKREGA